MLSHLRDSALGLVDLLGDSESDSRTPAYLPPVVVVIPWPLETMKTAKPREVHCLIWQNGALTSSLADMRGEQLRTSMIECLELKMLAPQSLWCFFAPVGHKWDFLSSNWVRKNRERQIYYHRRHHFAVKVADGATPYVLLYPRQDSPLSPVLAKRARSEVDIPEQDSSLLFSILQQQNVLLERMNEHENLLRAILRRLNEAEVRKPHTSALSS